MRTRRVRRSTAMLLAVVPVLPPAADAAVVQLHAGGDSATGIGLVVTGLPGEANRLAIVRGPDGAVTVTDAGAPLLPGERCAGGGGAVTCSGGLPNAELNLTIATSDGDDGLSLAGLADYASSYVRAGSGNDVVTGGPGRDDLNGDAGDDHLDGGGGADGLGGGPGADVLGGGPGVDTVGYGGEQPVTVTLDGLPGDGAAGEGDHVAADVENVNGTFGRTASSARRGRTGWTAARATTRSSAPAATTCCSARRWRAAGSWAALAGTSSSQGPTARSTLATARSTGCAAGRWRGR